MLRDRMLGVLYLIFSRFLICAKRTQHTTLTKSQRERESHSQHV